MTNTDRQQTVTEANIWLRGLYMVLFLLIYNVAEMVMLASVLFQFITKLLTGKTNRRILEFGQSLSLFIYQVWRFLTFNSESLPFPFAPWPESKVTGQDLL
jgi:hypothetical protein